MNILNASRGMSEKPILTSPLLATQISSMEIPQAILMGKNKLIVGMMGHFILGGLIPMVLMPKNCKKRLTMS